MHLVRDFQACSFCRLSLFVRMVTRVRTGCEGGLFTWPFFCRPASSSKQYCHLNGVQPKHRKKLLRYTFLSKRTNVRIWIVLQNPFVTRDIAIFKNQIKYDCNRHHVTSWMRCPVRFMWCFLLMKTFCFVRASTCEHCLPAATSCKLQWINGHVWNENTLPQRFTPSSVRSNFFRTCNLCEKILQSICSFAILGFSLNTIITVILIINHSTLLKMH